MGCALCHTNGFESPVNPVHAVVTLNRLIADRIDLGNMPRAGATAGHTADALFFIDIDDTIFPLNHGLCGTDRYAERFIAVIAGLESEFGLGNSPDLL